MVALVSVDDVVENELLAIERVVERTVEWSEYCDDEDEERT